MATLEETLDKAIDVAVKRAILKAHPVGSLYLSLTEENPSISLGGGVHGSRLARENVCGERTVAMQWEQKLVQGCRISRARGRRHGMCHRVAFITCLRQGLSTQSRTQVVQVVSQDKTQEANSTWGIRALTQANRTQSTVHQRRFNRPPWRSTFGRGQHEYD